MAPGRAGNEEAHCLHADGKLLLLLYEHRDAGKYYADFFEDFDERRYEEALQRMELNPKDKIRTLSIPA